MFSHDVYDISSLIEYCFFVGISPKEIEAKKNESNLSPFPAEIHKIFPLEKENGFNQATLNVNNIK